MKTCRCHVKSLMVVIALLFFPLISVYAAPSTDRVRLLEEKIQKLEDEQKRLSERQYRLQSPAPQPGEPVHSFFNNALYLGGFFEPAYHVMSGPATKFQAAEISNILGLNISALYSEQIRFVNQTVVALTIPITNPHNDPRATLVGQPSRRSISTYTFGALVTQAYVEYRVSDYFLIQGGIGYSPFGLSVQQREPVLYERRGGPQITRVPTLVAPLWSGFQIQGMYSLDKSEANWGYKVYSFSPPSYPQYPGIGGHLWWAKKGDNLRFGLSTQIGKLGAITTHAAGADARVKFGRFSVISEYVHNFVHSGDDPWSAYIEPNIELFHEVVLAYIFADYAENPLNKTGVGPTAFFDPYRKWEYGGGINWLPTSYVRLRLGLTYHDYVGANAQPSGQNRNYLSGDISAGVTF